MRVKIGIKEHIRRVEWNLGVNFATHGACGFSTNLQRSCEIQNRLNSTCYFKRLSDYGTLLSLPLGACGISVNPYMECGSQKLPFGSFRNDTFLDF